MNTLGHGVTPKMKPIPARRSVAVAALDVGSSKVVRLIGRLRPMAAQQVLTRRSALRRGDRFRPHRCARDEGRDRR